MRNSAVSFEDAARAVGRVNPLAAMTNASAVAGEIVNDQGARYQPLFAARRAGSLDAERLVGSVQLGLSVAGCRRSATRPLEKQFARCKPSRTRKPKQQRLVNYIRALAQTDVYGRWPRQNRCRKSPV